MFDKLKALLAVKTAKKAREEIGRGAFGVVYSDVPGTVVKKIAEEKTDKLLNEINLQAKAAELNLAPKIKEATISDIEGGSISMEDLRKNYIPLGQPGVSQPLETGNRGIIEAKTNYYVEFNPELNSQQVTKAQVDTHKQLAELALNDIMLSDRHVGNIFVNKMSNRPMQIDFGMANEIKTPSEKAGALTYHVGNGLNAAGLNEEARIFTQLVNEVGKFNFETNSYDNPAAALDMAKQGLSRLQKIKTPQIEQIAAVRQQELNAYKVILQEPTVPQQRLNTWGEPIERGYYGTPL
jgi:hypothetical protein